MEAGDLHDPGSTLRRESGQSAEPITPQQALDEMREAVERLRRQLQGGVLTSPSAMPDEESLPDDADDEDESGG